MQRQYHWHDERQGRFTIIDAHKDRVEFRLGPAHLRGAVVGPLLGLLVAAGFVRQLWVAPVLSIGSIVSGVVLAAIALFVLRGLRAARHSKREPVVIVYDAAPPTQCDGSGAAIVASDIEAVEVRENTGRKFDDMAMWQTYLHVAGQPYAVLLHQRPKWSYARERAIAESLASRWKVPLIEPTPAR